MNNTKIRREPPIDLTDKRVGILFESPDIPFLKKHFICNWKKSIVLNAKDYDALKQCILDNSIQVIISEKTMISKLNPLQWECESFSTYYITNSEKPLSEVEPQKNKLMNKKLWDFTAVNAKNQTEGGGWCTSYTRETFSPKEMEEFSENVYHKLKPYLNDQIKVLEIGCSSGLTMFRLAPYTGQYHAIDLSKVILEKNLVTAQSRGITNISLYHLSAEEIASIGIKDFDVIIMNSVIQCFHGYNYLRYVLRCCIDCMSPEGIIFLGDIMDLDLKNKLLASILQYKKLHPKADAKVNRMNEVLYAKDFFRDLSCEFQEISSVDISSKLYTIPNELTKYRYDVILSINKKNNAKPAWKKRKCQLGLKGDNA